MKRFDRLMHNVAFDLEQILKIPVRREVENADFSRLAPLVVLQRQNATLDDDTEAITANFHIKIFYKNLAAPVDSAADDIADKILKMLKQNYQALDFCAWLNVRAVEWEYLDSDPQLTPVTISCRACLV